MSKFVWAGLAGLVLSQWHGSVAAEKPGAEQQTAGKQSPERQSKDP